MVVWQDIIINSINSQPHKQLQSLNCRGIGRIPENTDKYQHNCILSEKRYTRYQEPVDQPGYFRHSHYEVSYYKEKERNGAGEQIQGTAPGRPVGAKIFADCVRTPRQPEIRSNVLSTESIASCLNAFNRLCQSQLFVWSFQHRVDNVPFCRIGTVEPSDENKTDLMTLKKN